MRKFHFAVAVLAAGAVCSAFATPAIDSAKVTTRTFNDFPASELHVTNLYPALVSVSDDAHGAAGSFANRHIFNLSDDGGANYAVFLNNDSFAFSADVTLTGPGEGGLHVGPWWSPENDGQIMLNGNSGEIAVFGGRLPFYSFTTNHGLHYVNGSTVRMGVSYNAHSNTMADPGTIQYYVKIGATSYFSPVLPLDQGNPSEDPPHGLYGLLNPYYPGGYYQAYLNQGPSSISWANATFVPEPSCLALLGLAVLGLRRR